MNRVLLVGVFGSLAAACSCSNKGNGPLADVPPSNLAAAGLIIDQPAEGDSVSGAWVTVSGWVSRDWVQGLAISGAPVDGFYGSTGHVGAPAVPMTLRADGRFFAPRVPLSEGQTQLVVVAFGKGGSTYEAVTRTVTASGTRATPATLVISPAQPEPGQAATLRATNGVDVTTPFQWDFDGDGTFDAEGAQVTHAWPSPGRFDVIARTKVKGQWVSAFAEVTVGTLPAVIASAEVGVVSGLFVLPRYLEPGVDSLEYPDGGQQLETRWVAVTEPTQVRVFDAQLNEQFILPGLSQPSGLASDRKGNFYVADTGNNRVVRFTAQGALDPTFGSGGEYKGTTDAPMMAPRAIAYGGSKVLTGSTVVLRCHQAPTYVCEHDDDEYEQTELKALGINSLTRFVLRPDPVVIIDEPGIYLADGQVLNREMGSFKATGIRALDVAPSRNMVNALMAVADQAGALRIYRGGSAVATWKLPYAVKAVGISPDGHLYVAGDGHLELREFELLE